MWGGLRLGRSVLTAGRITLSRFFGAYFKPYEGESESVLMGGTDDITDVSATAFPVRV